MATKQYCSAEAAYSQRPAAVAASGSAFLVESFGNPETGSSYPLMYNHSMTANHVPKRSPIHVIGPSIAYVPLTRGQYALVDSDLADDLSRFNWTATWSRTSDNFRPQRVANGKGIGIHRQIMSVSDPQILVDHKNRNPLDNRRANLRLANKTQNSINSRINRNNTSGFTGVVKDGKWWRAYMKVNGKTISVGWRKTPEEANDLVVEARRKLHGDFCPL